MRRKLFNLAAAVSMVMCVAVCALWARSYWRGDRVGAVASENADLWQRGGFVSSAGGGLHVHWWLRPNERSTQATWDHGSWPLGSTAPQPFRHGFRYEASTVDISRHRSDGRAVPKRLAYAHDVMVPYWFILLLTAAPVAVWVLQKKRRGRHLLKNLCVACGYDLRATPERCPECGAVPVAAK